jgi:hypothetical protein
MLEHLFPRAVEPSGDDYDTAPFRPLRQQSRGHLRRHPATRRTRWLWLVPLAAGLLTVLGWVLAHDPGPGLALSGRGWLQVGLAAALVLLLARHRSDSTWRLLRMLGEYTAVALLAILLVSPASVQHPPTPAPQHPAARARAAAEVAGDACPSIVQLRAWLSCLWQASQQAARGHRPPTTTPRKGHAMALSPPSLLTSRRTDELV